MISKVYDLYGPCDPLGDKNPALKLHNVVTTILRNGEDYSLSGLQG